MGHVVPRLYDAVSRYRSTVSDVRIGTAPFHLATIVPGGDFVGPSGTFGCLLIRPVHYIAGAGEWSKHRTYKLSQAQGQ